MERSNAILMTAIFAVLVVLAAFAPANARVIFVAASATGADDGTSWDDAYADLQDALATAIVNDSIWVASGTYKPTADVARDSTFQLISGVSIYGGFAGTEMDVSERNWETNVTVLSGDIGAGGIDTDNSYHVVTGSGTDSTAVLDGFTVTRGYAADPGVIYGGGMYIVSGSPTLANLTFRGNFARYGGGMASFDSNPSLDNVAFLSNSIVMQGCGGGMYNNASNPTLTNVSFLSNIAPWERGSGGGMYNDASSPTLINVTFESENIAEVGAGMSNAWGSNPTLDNVHFAHNRANYMGAGMYNVFSNPILTNVTFYDNNVDHSPGGGGMMNDNSSPTLANVVFSENDAVNGGGMHNRTSHPILTNVTFSRNEATLGGAMYNDGSSPTIVNVILWGDSATSGGPEIYNVTSAPEISYSLIAGSGGSGGGWDPSLGTDGGNNLDADPLFVDGLGGNLHLMAGSPAIDAGDNGAPNLPATDLDGIPRIVNGTVDMGAYEFDPSTAVEDTPAIPPDYALREAAPNPFNPMTTIRFDLPRSSAVTLTVYDIAGRIVRRLVQADWRTAGKHSVVWQGKDDNGKSVASGVYLYRLVASDYVATRRLTLLK